MPGEEVELGAAGVRALTGELRRCFFLGEGDSVVIAIEGDRRAAVDPFESGGVGKPTCSLPFSRCSSSFSSSPMDRLPRPLFLGDTSSSFCCSTRAPNNSNRPSSSSGEGGNLVLERLGDSTTPSRPTPRPGAGAGVSALLFLRRGEREGTTTPTKMEDSRRLRSVVVGLEVEGARAGGEGRVNSVRFGWKKVEAGRERFSGEEEDDFGGEDGGFVSGEEVAGRRVVSLRLGREREVGRGGGGISSGSESGLAREWRSGEEVLGCGRMASSQ